jgi:hypothetical protein
VSIIWLALALGIATTLMSYFSSATRYESFIGSLQYGLLYTVSHAIFTTAIFTGLFYTVLLVASCLW